MLKALYRLARVVLAFVILAAGWAGYQGWDILRVWHTARPAAADAAVVLGAAVWNGSPSPAFAERLDVAVGLYESGLVPRFICTGGKGPEEISEAAACRRYLIEHGVPDEQIALEEQSATTWGNLTNAKPLLEAADARRVLLVTHGYHLKRSLMQARDLGIEAEGAPVMIMPHNLSYYMLREIAAITYYQLGFRAPPPPIPLPISENS